MLFGREVLRGDFAALLPRGVAACEVTPFWSMWERIRLKRLRLSGVVCSFEKKGIRGLDALRALGGIAARPLTSLRSPLRGALAALFRGGI